MTSSPDRAIETPTNDPNPIIMTDLKMIGEKVNLFQKRHDLKHETTYKMEINLSNTKLKSAWTSATRKNSTL